MRLSRPALAVLQVHRLEDVGDDARDVVDHAERDQHQRERAEDPEERPEPRRDDRLQRLAFGPDESEVGLPGDLLPVTAWNRRASRRP